MPLDYENLTQYKTPFNRPDCGEHIFQTDAALRLEFDFIEAGRTNCRHASTTDEIASQMGETSDAAMKDTLA